MSNPNLYSPSVNPENGYIDFSMIRVDNKEVFMHNFTKFVNKITKEEKDIPKTYMIIANEDGHSENLTVTDIKNRHYSHEELKYAVTIPTYTLPTATERKDTTIENANLILMNNPDLSDSELIISDENLAFTFDIGKPFDFYPDQYIINARRMSTNYDHGDIAYSTSRTVPSYIRMRCVRTGMTSPLPFALALASQSSS